MADSSKPQATSHPIWMFQHRLTARLLTWSAVSVVVGLAMQRSTPFRRGFGAQAVGWGAVDAAIAWFGRRGAERNAIDAQSERSMREARRLRRLLWLNGALDVLYMIGGAQLAQTKGREDDGWRGHGWGIVVQGAFLLIFDIWHGWRTPGPFRQSTSDGSEPTN